MNVLPSFIAVPASGAQSANSAAASAAKSADLLSTVEGNQAATNAAAASDATQVANAAAQTASQNAQSALSATPQKGLFTQVLSLLQQSQQVPAAPAVNLQELAIAGLATTKKDEDTKTEANSAIDPLSLLANPALAALVAPSAIVPVAPVTPVVQNQSIALTSNNATSLLAANEVLFTNAAQATAQATADLAAQGAIDSAIATNATNAANAAATSLAGSQAKADNATAAAETLKDLFINTPKADIAPTQTEAAAAPAISTPALPAPTLPATTASDLIAAKAAQTTGQADMVSNLVKNPAITVPAAPVAPAAVTGEAKPIALASDNKTTEISGAAQAAKSQRIEGGKFGAKNAGQETGKEGTQDQSHNALLQDVTPKFQLADKVDAVKKPEIGYQNAIPLPTPAEQIKVSITKAMHEGDGHISIQLTPGGLGHVDIRMEVTADGKTNIHIAAEKHDTLQLLQRDSHHLEKSLADAGLKTESGGLNFSLRDGSAAFQGRRESQQQQNSTQTYNNGKADDVNGTTLATVKQYTGYLSMNNGVDIQA
jgi:flagellar hook-length control protein FliK